MDNQNKSKELIYKMIKRHSKRKIVKQMKGREKKKKTDLNVYNSTEFIEK